MWVVSRNNFTLNDNEYVQKLTCIGKDELDGIRGRKKAERMGFFKNLFLLSSEI
jgi:hypothetical protein